MTLISVCEFCNTELKEGEDRHLIVSGGVNGDGAELAQLCNMCAELLVSQVRSLIACGRCCALVGHACDDYPRVRSTPR